MNLENLKHLRKTIAKEKDLNTIRDTIKREFDLIIRFLEENLEEDFRHLEADIHELETLSISNHDDLNEIIGNIKTDFSEFEKDFDMEL